MARIVRFLVAFAILDLTFHFGMWRGEEKARINYFEGPEGYCLADKPPHPGECTQP